MAIRPQDSTLKFDNIPDPIEEEDGPSGVHPGHSTPGGSSDSALDDGDDAPSATERLPMMIPHFSDGTTDVLVRGRNHDAGDPTEPMFPRTEAPPTQESPASVPNAEPLDDDAPTVQLARVAAETHESTPSSGEGGVVEAPTEMFSTTPATDEASSVQPHTDLVDSSSPRSSPAAKRPDAGSNNGSLAFMLLLSYASAVTLALIYLLLTRGGGGASQHQLENLRDPADEEGTVRIIQRSVDLPPGHSLALAESQRFGNIRVTPLRVTRGPIEFIHFSGDRKKRMPATPPVYKLWLRFENVSADQEIAPLDGLLLYKRAMNQQGDLVANTFLCAATADREGAVVFSYPVSPTSEWDMRDQNLGRPLKPGESIETFIPSDVDGLEQLQGELVWRFQMRKGYAPTGRGVTTLVEVVFPVSQVETESTSATAERSDSRSSRSGHRLTFPGRDGWSIATATRHG